MKISAKELFSIPNCLSYLRLILIPVFIFIFINASTQSDYFLAAFIVLFSALTDLGDGFIARRFNMITDFGKILDPIADKLTQLVVLLCLLTLFNEMWVLVILLIARDLFMGISGLIFLKKGKKLDGAKWFGKVSTAVFFISTVLLIAWPNMADTLITVIMIVMMVFFLLSFLLYSHVYFKMYKESK